MRPIYIYSTIWNQMTGKQLTAVRPCNQSRECCWHNVLWKTTVCSFCCDDLETFRTWIETQAILKCVLRWFITLHSGVSTPRAKNRGSDGRQRRVLFSALYLSNRAARFTRFLINKVAGRFQALLQTVEMELNPWKTEKQPRFENVPQKQSMNGKIVQIEMLSCE